ncbi:MAG: DsbA family protein, partial [Acidimicrobiia bacterium]|nr:DsbA family protein [Acidimicrobiia bacterium]
MRVDIWSDVVCPWCSIAKRRFDAAVAEVGLDVDVRARAFQLDPSAPPGTT